MRNFNTVKPPKSIEILVRNIWVLKNESNSGLTTLPFFADGFPGLVFHESGGELIVYPQNKVMPSLFLYGQTIHPIEMRLSGHFRLVVFQFYPFVLKRIFGLNPKDLEDNCHNLSDWAKPLKETKLSENTNSILSYDQVIQHISQKLLEKLSQYKSEIDIRILDAIHIILERNGNIVSQEIAEKASLSKRALERNFYKETGLTPKQFSQIIQFNSSLSQLEAKTYQKLSDVVYLNGYADQSHFIKVFKSFTGKTPKHFK